MSMTRSILVVLAIIVIAGVAYAMTLPTPAPQTNPISTILNTPTSTSDSSEDELSRIVRPELGLAFSYPEGNEGYLLSDITSAMEQSPNFAGGSLLIRTEDARVAAEAMEGPPSIGLRVYRNTDKQFPLSWAEQHPQNSNYNLALGDTTDTVIGGANGIRYRVDGLYATETAIVMSGSYTYVITGGFIDENDQIRLDYENLLKTIEFVPEV